MVVSIELLDFKDMTSYTLLDTTKLQRILLSSSRTLKIQILLVFENKITRFHIP